MYSGGRLLATNLSLQSPLFFSNISSALKTVTYVCLHFIISPSQLLLGLKLYFDLTSPQLKRGISDVFIKTDHFRHLLIRNSTHTSTHVANWASYTHHSAYVFSLPLCIAAMMTPWLLPVHLSQDGEAIDCCKEECMKRVYLQNCHGSFPQHHWYKTY